LQYHRAAGAVGNIGDLDVNHYVGTRLMNNGSHVASQ
jgi:hypothetical protein